MARKKVPANVKAAVLLEAGYRCAVPTCRQLFLLDLHHLTQVSDEGGDTVGNLLALCPTCHAAHHRGHIPTEAIRAYKAMVVSLGRAFDHETIDRLIFLSKPEVSRLLVSGDGVLQFNRLIAAGLATFKRQGGIIQSGRPLPYRLELTEVGKLLVEAWRSGHSERISEALQSWSMVEVD